MLKDIDSNLINKLPKLDTIYIFNNMLPKEQNCSYYFNIESHRKVHVDT